MFSKTEWYAENKDSYLKRKRDSYHQRKRERARLKMKEPVYEMTPQRKHDFLRVFEVSSESVKIKILKQLNINLN